MRVEIAVDKESFETFGSEFRTYWMPVFVSRTVSCSTSLIKIWKQKEETKTEELPNCLSKNWNSSFHIPVWRFFAWSNWLCKPDHFDNKKNSQIWKEWIYAKPSKAALLKFGIGTSSSFFNCSNDIVCKVSAKNVTTLLFPWLPKKDQQKKNSNITHHERVNIYKKLKHQFQ